MDVADAQLPCCRHGFQWLTKRVVLNNHAPLPCKTSMSICRESYAPSPVTQYFTLLCRWVVICYGQWFTNEAGLFLEPRSCARCVLGQCHIPVCTCVCMPSHCTHHTSYGCEHSDAENDLMHTNAFLQCGTHFWDSLKCQ